VTVAVLDVRGTRPAITPTSADVGRIDHIGDLSTRAATDRFSGKQRVAPPYQP